MRSLRPWSALHIAVTAFTLALIALVLTLGGFKGVLYAAGVLLATLPGWPIGHALFGKRHAAGWVSGALIGYALTAFAIWTVIASGMPSLPAFVVVWALAALGTWFALRTHQQPLIALPAWTEKDTQALLFTLLLVPAIFWRPYSHLGLQDANGSTYYRAYFTADFVWHMALTAEVSKFDMPPQNPFLAHQPIHYYWTYFLVPAAVKGSVPGFGSALELCLKINAVVCGCLSVAMLFVAAWCAAPKARAVAAAVVVALVASSVEGLYVLYDQYSRGRPLARVFDLNIRAIANWYFGGLRVDGLIRLLWYNPQHSMAGALGLIAVPVAGAGGGNALAAVLAGIALAGAVTFNPFVGGVFALIYGAVEVAAALPRVRDVVRRILVSGLAAVPVGLALYWCVRNVMLEGAGGAIQFGFGGDAARAPIRTLLLSSGPLLVAGVLGLWPFRRLPRSLWPAIAGVALSLVMMYLMRLSVDAAWVGFRSSQILHLVLTILAAAFFAHLRRGWVIAAVAAVLIAVGLPTTAIDAYNAQDIANRGRSPGGFPWTIEITRQERDALEWIRRQTPRTAVVQMDAITRARITWSLIPSFAERRMAGGNAIPLLEVPAYREISNQVHRGIYRGRSPQAAWDTARGLGIDYIYVGPAERAGLPATALAKFDQRPDLFARVFGNDEAAVFEVRRR